MLVGMKSKGKAIRLTKADCRLQHRTSGRGLHWECINTPSPPKPEGTMSTSEQPVKGPWHPRRGVSHSWRCEQMNGTGGCGYMLGPVLVRTKARELLCELLGKRFARIELATFSLRGPQNYLDPSVSLLSLFLQLLVFLLLYITWNLSCISFSVAGLAYG